MKVCAYCKKEGTKSRPLVRVAGTDEVVHALCVVFLDQKKLKDKKGRFII